MSGLKAVNDSLCDCEASIVNLSLNVNLTNYINFAYFDFLLQMPLKQEKIMIE